nr:MAG TPA: hypothetical protein [Caudoviricetes sp.]
MLLPLFFIPFLPLLIGLKTYIERKQQNEERT